MEQPANHQCFEAAVSDILSRLYEAFPKSVDLHFETAHKEASARGAMPEHCAAAFAKRPYLYGSTIEFLEREKIIHVSKTDSFNAEGMVLTSKGFVLLQREVPALDSEGGHQRLGDAFKELRPLVYSSLVSHVMDFFWKKITGT